MAHRVLYAIVVRCPATGVVLTTVYIGKTINPKQRLGQYISTVIDGWWVGW